MQDLIHDGQTFYYRVISQSPLYQVSKANSFLMLKYIILVWNLFITYVRRNVYNEDIATKIYTYKRFSCKINYLNTTFGWEPSLQRLNHLSSPPESFHHSLKYVRATTKYFCWAYAHFCYLRNYLPESEVKNKHRINLNFFVEIISSLGNCCFLLYTCRTRESSLKLRRAETAEEGRKQVRRGVWKAVWAGLTVWLVTLWPCVHEQGLVSSGVGDWSCCSSWS